MSTSVQRLKFGDCEFDERSGELWRNGDSVVLPNQTFRLLAVLIHRPGIVVTRDELCRELWPEGTFVDFEHSLNAGVKRLREALGDSAAAPRFIETIPQRGYRFIGSVEDSSAAAGTRPNTRHRSRKAPSGVVHTLRCGNQEYLLDEGENLVGREPTAQLFLTSASVSRRHALINVSGDRATLTDLASKNGTFIGKEPLLDEAILTDGTLIRFGSVEVLYRCGVPAGPTDTFRAR